MCAVLVSLTAGLGAISCTTKTDFITAAYSPFETIALAWIAQDQNFFSQNGLNITWRKYDSGAGALAGMLKGEADIVVGTTEFPVVGRAFQKEPMLIIGNIDKVDLIYLVARKDRGIDEVSDLKGKRVGTTFGTVAHFYLGRFLDLNGLGIQDVVPVDLKTPEEWVNAIVDGDVDAVCTAKPYIESIRDKMDGNVLIWPAQSSQSTYGLIISSPGWVAEHPEPAGRFLKSLVQAEGYFIHHPQEAKSIVQKSLGLDAPYVETVWPRNQYSVSLDQSLILSMEDEARWMINNDLTTEKQVPDFLNYVDESYLKAIKPESVNIIR